MVLRCKGVRGPNGFDGLWVCLICRVAEWGGNTRSGTYCRDRQVKGSPTRGAKLMGISVACSKRNKVMEEETHRAHFTRNTSTLHPKQWILTKSSDSSMLSFLSGLIQVRTHKYPKP